MLGCKTHCYARRRAAPKRSQGSTSGLTRVQAERELRKRIDHDLRKRFCEVITRAGVREITFHELRHTFGTQMAAAGAPLRAIQEWMGHADAKTTEIYRLRSRPN